MSIFHRLLTNPPGIKENRPHVLFNTVALNTGLIQTLPEDAPEFTETRSEQKILLVCQDIINISGKATHKTMAMGLTIKISQHDLVLF